MGVVSEEDSPGTCHQGSPCSCCKSAGPSAITLSVSTCNTGLRGASSSHSLGRKVMTGSLRILVLAALCITLSVVPVSALDTASCEEFALALANATITQVTIPATLTVGACMTWTAPVTIDRSVTVTGPDNAVGQLVIKEQAFLDYFVVSGALTFQGMHIVAPAESQLTTSNSFLPIVFLPSLGSINFLQCVIILSNYNYQNYTTDVPPSLPGVSPTQVSQVNASYAPQLIPNQAGLHSVTAVWTRNQVLGTLVPGPFAKAVGAAADSASWNFVDSFTLAPSPYAGGLLVSDGNTLGLAFVDQSVTAIFIQNDIDIGAYFEANSAALAPRNIDRDLHFYGFRGLAVDWRWSNSELYLQPGRVLTMDGGLLFKRVNRPNLASIPYSFFLGHIVAMNGSTVIMNDLVIEHSWEDDVELRVLAGEADALPETYDEVDFHVNNFDSRAQVTSIIRLQTIKALPAELQPQIHFVDKNLFLQSWSISSPDFDKASNSRPNFNNVNGLYRLSNILLVDPTDGVNECDNTTGFSAFDSKTFRDAFMDKLVYRIKLTQDFAINPADWPTPDVPAVGINVTRNVRVIGCVKGKDYSLIDTVQLYRVVYMMNIGSLIFRRVQFTNCLQMPRRGYMENMQAMFSTADNSTISFQACTFQGPDPNQAGPFLNDNFDLGPANILLPNKSTIVRLTDDSTGQRSAVMGHWDLGLGLWLAYSRGNESALDLLGSWNFMGCLVNTAPQGGSGSGGKSHTTLALAIALPLAAALCCVVLVALLLRRRRHAQSPPSVKSDLNANPKQEYISGVRQSDEDVSIPTMPSSSRILEKARSTDERTSAQRSVEIDNASSGAMEDKIDAALLKMGKNAFSANAWEQIKLGRCIGTGGFSKVYKGFWRGSVVAVKVINLPERLTRTEKFRRMMIMETAISASLSHPNIIPTYTYAVRSTMSRHSEEIERTESRSTPGNTNPSARADSSLSSELPVVSGETTRPEDVLAEACEVRLVQEYASLGTLRDILNQNVLCAGDPEGRQDFGRVLDTAMDICKALVHLHNENIVHCDLKASNVLIVPMADSRKGFVAKVADFGMAQSLLSNESHVSNVFHGTLTHMAPECLVSGHVTFASDIYSMAIIMWELITRQTVKLSCLASLVPFMVSARGMRPILPNYVPKLYADLVRECWAGNHDLRPTAHQVYHRLARISVDFAEGALGPCILGRSNESPDAVNTEFTSDHVSTHLLNVGSTSRATLEYVDELREACTSLCASTGRTSSRQRIPGVATTASGPILSGSSADSNNIRSVSPAAMSNDLTTSQDRDATATFSTPESVQPNSRSSGSLPCVQEDASINPSFGDALRTAGPGPSGLQDAGVDKAEKIAADDDLPSSSSVSGIPGLTRAEVERHFGSESHGLASLPGFKPTVHSALPRAAPSSQSNAAIVFRDKATSETWDTFMLNHSEVGLQGFGLKDIAEPPEDPHLAEQLLKPEMQVLPARQPAQGEPSA